MKAYASKILPALAIIGIVIGVNVTYNRYRGTGLSRVPEIGASRLEAATRAGRDDPQGKRADAVSARARYAWSPPWRSVQASV